MFKQLQPQLLPVNAAYVTVASMDSEVLSIAE